MKTMLFFLCLFSFSVVMAQNDKLLTKQDVIGREMFINDEWVRLREGPSLNDKIITSLGYGKAGVILEVSTESIVAGESNRWYRIQLPYGEIGWVWGKYVSLVAEVAEIEKIRRVSDTVLTQNDLDVHGLSNIQSISDIIPYYQEYYKTYNNLHYGIDLVIDSGNEDILLGFSGKVYSNGYDEAEGYTVHMGYGYEFEDSFIDLGIYGEYGHLKEKSQLTVGNMYQGNKTVGLFGNTGTKTTGAHLHYSIYTQDNVSFSNTTMKLLLGLDYSKDSMYNGSWRTVYNPSKLFEIYKD